MVTSREEDLVDSLVQTSFLVMGSLNRIGAEHGFSLTQMRVFGILRDRRLRMADLANYLGLEKSTMSGLVDRAEERGLVRRERNQDDGRAVDVFLSEEGLDYSERIQEEVKLVLSPLTGKLAPDDRDRLTSALNRMLGV